MNKVTHMCEDALNTSMFDLLHGFTVSQHDDSCTRITSEFLYAWNTSSMLCL